MIWDQMLGFADSIVSLELIDESGSFPLFHISLDFNDLGTLRP
jgi:hypothetical protein